MDYANELAERTADEIGVELWGGMYSPEHSTSDAKNKAAIKEIIRNALTEAFKCNAEVALKLCYAIENLPASKQQTACSIMASDLRAALEMGKARPRFPNTYCSHCGGEFGPGDHGFSHCDNHKHLTRLD